MPDLEITVDGSCTPWHKMASGLVVRDAVTKELLALDHSDLGWGTNNRAEYLAIDWACSYAHKFAELNNSITIYTDSQLVLRQLQGAYRIRDARLRKLHATVVQKLRQWKARVVWHRRDENDGPLADKLASYRWKEAISENRIQSEGTGGHNTRPPFETSGIEVGGCRNSADLEKTAASSSNT